MAELATEFIPKTTLEMKEGETLYYKSASLCPECLKLIPMNVFEKDGKVLLRKACKEHGTIEDVYWGNSELFKKAKTFEVKGRGLENPFITKDNPICPQDCGLCSIHETHSGLTNLVITNRCDLTCWYCFFYAEKAGYIYEPTLDQIRGMVAQIKDEKPIAGNAIQITGGNPELRDDLPEIIKIIKEVGIDHVQLNTNGTNKLFKDLNFAKSIRAAGVNTVYLSYDGVTPQTNPKNHWEAPAILDNCRKSNLGVVLVPTVIRTINDHEIGDILKFGFDNNDIIKGVNYQPVSLVGRMPTKERERFRITIPDVIEKLEEATNGQVGREAFYPVPCTVILSNFVEALTGGPKYELSINPACGMATYIFKDGEKLIPITDFVDVDGLYGYLREQTEALQSGANKYVVIAKMMTKLPSFIDNDRQPKWLNLGKVLFNILVKHNYEALGAFHKNALFVGMMHFQDLYNWDIQRIKKCDIHYATPEGVIPFCTFNVIPEWYRDKIQKKHSISLQEWEQRTGQSLKGGYYKRNIKALMADPLYAKTYPKIAAKLAARAAALPVAQPAQSSCATGPGCGC
ncbi:MAG: radical SAM protein [Candidatus Aenigmarchaeota archaeon]|nr:radical SAM protein [Candidatus Aenigmarchaeota archaeon]